MADIGALVERLTTLGVSTKDASEIIAQAYAAGVAAKPARQRQAQRELLAAADKPAKGTRIPKDFKPDIEFALSLGIPRHRALRDADNFCDYWSGVPGSKGIKSDWPATWRNRCRALADHLGIVPPAPPRSDAIDPRQMTPEQWRPILAVYERTSNWNPAFGPEPGLPGSFAPQQRSML